MIPVVATEIEFTLFGSQGRDLAGFWHELRNCGLPIFKIEKERGREQHEVALLHTRDIEKIISDTEQLKRRIKNLAQTHDMQASFAARPVADEPGNGLHVHVHLEDESGKNLYWKREEEMSEALAYSISGLLATMRDHLNVFLPTAESRARIVAASNAPTTVSWGANNRTCAIRLPDKAWDNKHIEHRVAGADADIAKVIEVILSGIMHGIANRITPPPQIYGDASLEMYGLPGLL